MSTRISKKLRDAVLDRDSRQCQRCYVWLWDMPYSIHHRRRKGMGGSGLLDTMANLVTVCGTGTTGCHGEIESYRSDSYSSGWLVPNGVTPEEWPVERFGERDRWEQPGVEWTPAEPHPRQIELRSAA